MQASNQALNESILFFGSDKVFDSSLSSQQPQQAQHATTNALLLKFDHLAKDNEVRTGDPTYCSRCKAVLNTCSSLIKNDKGSQQWTCEFCGQLNDDIELDEEEVPKKEPQDFVSGTLIIEEEKKDDKTLAAEDESNVIFCIDTSGSMSMTTSVKGGHQYKDLGSKSLFKSASSKNDEEEEVWVSRLEFVQSAVDAQLEAMKRDTPKRKVGIISFSAQVVFYDDLGKAHEIKGPALDDYSGLLEKGSSFSLERPIAQTRDELGRTVKSLNDGGATALGPALLIAISIASQKPGSKVIICTDGLANVGVGSLEGETGGDFYEQVAQYARRKGVVLSVISIKGADTRLEKLGALADITRGTVDLVDPDNLDFSNLISAASLATNCVVTLYLHPALRFVNEENEEKGGVVIEENLNYTKLIKDIGNASTDTQVCFEFSRKEDSKLIIMGDKIPFQIQISYTKLNGMECKRVLTVMREVTTDRQEAQKNLDICVISANLAQQSARMAKAGNYEEALQNARRVKALIETQVQSEEQKKLFEIFMKEFREIGNALESAMAAEADVGGGFATSSFSRTENRSDYMAHKLYSHKAAKAEACLVM